MASSLDGMVVRRFVKDCGDLFGSRLVSVVLFGSVARNTAVKGSDIDLIVIAEGLPFRSLDRRRLFSDLRVIYLMKYGVKLSVMPLAPGDLQAEKINPLFYGVLTGYKILYDRKGFFAGCIESMRPQITKNSPEYSVGGRDGKRWKIADLI